MPDDPISPSDDIAQKAQGWRLEANLFRQQAQAQIGQAEALEAAIVSFANPAITV